MRFAFISAMDGYLWGGSEELWSRAAVHLRKNGHEVFALVPWWPKLSPRVTALSALGIQLCVQRTGAPGFCARVLRKFERSLDLDTPELRRLIKQRPDLVCVSNGNYSDGLRFMESCCNHALPYVSVVQANAEFMWPADAKAERLIKVYKNARKTFFVSNGNRALLETQLGISLENAQVVRNPFNVRWDTTLPWPDERNGLKIACVARLDPPAKAQDLLMRVLASEIWRIRPVHVSFFGQGPMEQGLRRLATHLGLGQRVSFRGQVSDVESIWAEHHALILPSRYEGLPLALVEAMLCGRPAVITDVAGNAELVIDGVSGFVAYAATIKHLADAMDRAWAARAQWQSIGLAARLIARANIPKDPAAVFGELLQSLAL